MNCHVKSTSAGRDDIIQSSHVPSSDNRPLVSVYTYIIICTTVSKEFYNLNFYYYVHSVDLILLYSDGNPPVRLLCGHAISRDAMKKLISQSRRYNTSAVYHSHSPSSSSYSSPCSYCYISSLSLCPAVD